MKNGSYYGILSKCSGAKSSLDVFEWSTENGGNIAQYPYNAYDCQLFSITPVCPKVNDGLYSFRRMTDGKVTGNRDIKRLEDGRYTLTEESGKSGTYSIRCNADGSYTLVTSDNKESSYIFEPVAPKAADPDPIPEPIPAVLGDVDGNGRADQADADMLQRYLVRLGDLNDASQGDLNLDGKTDIFDLVLLKQNIL